MLQFIILVFLAHNSIVLTREYTECLQVTEPDTFVASKRSCAKYIFCDGRNSFEGECLGGNYFNELEGICDDPINVECDIVASGSISSIYDVHSTSYGVSESITTDDTWDKIDFKNEFKAMEGNSHYTNTAKVPQSLKCLGINGTKNIRHILHSDSCTAFYTCYNGVAIPMLCPRGLYFNDDNQRCEQQMPRNCKIRNVVLRSNCRKGVYDYMAHPQRCEYYHYCLNGFQLIMRCPYGFTWHYERRTCVHKSQSRCYVESSSMLTW